MDRPTDETGGAAATKPGAGGGPPPPTRPLHADLDRWGVERPDHPAIAWCDDGQDRSITYGRLASWSNQIGAQLVAAGVGRGDRVLICMDKGPEAIAAMLGTVKAGGAYVPLDPASPPARSRLIVDAAEPAAVLAQPSALAAIGEMLGPVPTAVVGTLATDLDRLEWEDGPTPFRFTGDDVAERDPAWRPVDVGSDDLAHVLFTSGSTGIPKGVQILHRNVMAFVDWAVDHFGYGPEDRLSGHSPLHFDLSTFDVFGSFAAGATLHPVPVTANINPADLAAFIRDRRLTQWFSVPSALNLLVRFEVIDHGDLPDLRRLVWCGEVLPTPTLIELMHRLPHVEFTNLYGPTEATIASSWYRVPAVPTDPTAPLPIGVACDGERLVVLDDDGRPAPDGEIGELNIGGVGLSPGYWRDPEKTATAFRRVESVGQRLYRTGDLARREPDGNIVFLGRTDSQIKSRGYRIELGEIEIALNALGDLVEEAAVVAIESGGFDGATICAAYVSSEGGCRPRDLKARLSEMVPDYMIPRRWLALNQLPRNVNGKIDRPLLRAQFDAGTTAPPIPKESP